MPSIRRGTWKLTEGARARVLAYLLVIVSSGALGFLAVLHLDQAALFDQLTPYQWWIVASSAIGGGAALFLSGDKLGQPGWIGAARAAAGGIWITFVGALIGGTLGLPLYGTMFGPFIVSVTLAGTPVLLMLWMFNIAGIHMLMGTYQRERDSIFTPERMTIPDHPDGLTLRVRGNFS
ncbi:hypothetical protein [Pseudooctadecabacter jejudonensis]|uniref:Uncharacterized protein n=1 Tax=Pseudooctadecabacter jejudonensis TaxID=1391910 RepID=A0A1Y5RPJ7_9RHOB|nr:hypothetical protein [Pseudooctadecabacter jejudonensis]SLN19650.1 hypothetical protein PSJ8397_00701 [Pseudooctadecabacter jejudonensis]